MKLSRASKTAAQTRIALMLAGSGLCGAAVAAGTDISSVPLFTARSVKPNFMFLMDDSASMFRWWLPDDSSRWAPKPTAKDRDPLSPAPNAYYEAGKVSTIYQHGQYTAQCNHLAYNPATTYLPPLDEQGIPQSPGRMSDFKDDSYKPFYFVYNGGQTAMNWERDANGDIKRNTFYAECASLIGQGDGAPVMRRVEVRDESEWQRQNFQNWRYYYSTRREMAKAAIKQVFRRVKDDYRVGYSRTSYDKAIDRSDTARTDKWEFLDIRDFDDNQKRKFFGAIHNSDNGANTPIRGALSKAGQYFANKAPEQSRDPIEHSCQRNFTLLATDGGWTKAGEKANFGPYGISKSMAVPVSVGQQDTGPSVKRPMRDSGGDGTETLADVAAYYYNTDLRDKNAFNNCPDHIDLCKNNVKGETADAFHSFGDSANHQHMTTMTLGLGLNGTLSYRPDYRTATTGKTPDESTGDFWDIVHEKNNKNWPAIQDPGTKNDYMPLTHNDDLWHAAVNGRGQYFSASDPTSLIRSISEALDIVRASTGAASAASTSTIRPTGDNNDAFVASYVSQKWTGDVQRFRVNPKTGALENLTWSARTELDKLAAADRNIFYKKPDSNTNRPFTAQNLREDRLGRKFRDFCDQPGASGNGKPEQCEMLPPEQLDAANKTENLVKFIRGDKSMPYYRKRESTLGDITNASLLYAGSPSFPYQDPTYVNYKTESASVNRAKIVLAAANDGMLHAFDRETGTEKWAFIPTAVMSNLYKLADTNYPNNHAAFVDATPVLADVYIDKGKGEGKKWYTIVVGGLGGGGRGYYALDITNPWAPEVLWEYNDHPDLGLSFGNPIITKRQGKDGKWVVVFASGMNNAKGVGKLFVLDAATGQLDIKEPLSTGVGTPDEPSGLTYINAWVAAEGDNQALRFYGGDLLGNLWRFDIDGLLDPKGDALLLAKLVGPGDKGKPQPVTTKPSLAEVKHNGIKYAMVYVATGKYLGISDLSDKSFQSFYAIKDPLTAKSWDKVRGSVDFVENTIAAGTATNGDPTRQVNSTPVDLSSKGGWYVDFPVAGERVSVAPSLALGAIYVPVNSPAPYTCQVGGSSFLYRFDILAGSGTASFRGDVLIQGLSVIQLTDGPNKGGIAPMSTGSDGGVRVDNENPPTFGVGLKRASWRELVK